MAARKKTATKKSASRKSASSRKPSDALALLKADHKTVNELAAKFEKTRKEEQKAQIAERICNELKVHAQIEEEIFYPAAREAMRESDSDLLDEAQVEHASAKDLIAQIEGGSGDELFEAKVKVLAEYVRHHVREEEREMFPKVKKTKLDLKELGERLMQRKMELMESGGGAGGSSAGSSRGGGSASRGGGRRGGGGRGSSGGGSQSEQSGGETMAAKGGGMELASGT